MLSVKETKTVNCISIFRGHQIEVHQKFILAIIWNYDVFGFDSGRTREYCDYFADNGFLVVLPGRVSN